MTPSQKYLKKIGLKDQDNIEIDELAALKLLASQMLSYDDETIAGLREKGAIWAKLRWVPETTQFQLNCGRIADTTYAASGHTISVSA